MLDWKIARLGAVRNLKLAPYDIRPSEMTCSRNPCNFRYLGVARQRVDLDLVDTDEGVDNDVKRIDPALRRHDDRGNLVGLPDCERGDLNAKLLRRRRGSHVRGYY